MILVDGKGSICTYTIDAKASEMTITSDGGLFFCYQLEMFSLSNCRMQILC